jgi:hypothetical protein
MKTLIIYYVAILLPIPLLYWSLFQSSSMFFVLLMSYALIYRGFTDGQRLIEKGLLNKKEFWKAFIPFWTSQYFRQLYFER